MIVAAAVFVEGDDEQSILPVVPADPGGIANRLINLPNDPVAEQHAAGTAIRIDEGVERRRVHVVMPQDVFEEVDEMRLDERVLRQFALSAIVEEIRKQRPAAFEVAEVVLSNLVLQIRPMNQLGKGYAQVLVNVPATGSELCLQQIE